jgi:hypothetical protein
MRRSPVYLAVHHFDDSVYYRHLDREAYLMLAALNQQLSLGAAIETAFGGTSLSEAEQAFKLQQYFAHAAELGWFCEPDARLDSTGVCA